MNKISAGQIWVHDGVTQKEGNRFIYITNVSDGVINGFSSSSVEGGDYQDMPSFTKYYILNNYILHYDPDWAPIVLGSVWEVKYEFSCCSMYTKKRYYYISPTYSFIEEGKRIYKFSTSQSPNGPWDDGDGYFDRGRQGYCMAQCLLSLYFEPYLGSRMENSEVQSTQIQTKRLLMIGED